MYVRTKPLPLHQLAAKEAEGLLRKGLNGMLDAVQQCRNKFTEADTLPHELESRFTTASENLQKGLEWVTAIKDQHN